MQQIADIHVPRSVGGRSIQGVFVGHPVKANRDALARGQCAEIHKAVLFKERRLKRIGKNYRLREGIAIES
jgi:hypothetical protein